MNPVNTDLQTAIDQLGLGKSTDTKPKDAFGQDAFLTLMVTQLKNQNPLEPMKNQEFLSQLSSFTTASGVQDLNKSFDSLTAALQSSQALQASSLVGRKVLVQSNVGNLPAQGAMNGVVDVPETVGNLQVGIYNGAGELVKVIDLGMQSQGQTKFNWDGTDSAGHTLPPGNYSIAAESTFNGQTYSLDTMIEAPVDSVTIGRNGQGMILNLGALGSVDIGQVRQIY